MRRCCGCIRFRSSATLIRGFAQTTIVPERFPVKSRLHKGWKAVAFNGVFVGAFNAIPRPLVRRFGWHLMAICREVGVRAQGSGIGKSSGKS